MADKEEIEIIEIEGCPDWMLTMGDCMSLLLCFFVMLLAFSSPNEEKLMNVIAGMQGALGIIPPVMRERGVSVYKDNKESLDDKVVDGSKDKVEFDVEKISPVDLRSMSIVNKFNSFKNRLVELGFKNHIQLTQLDEGIRMSIDFEQIFYRNSEKLLVSGTRLFESFANLVNIGANEVRLTAGLNSPRSVKDRSFATAWRLSNKRVAAIGHLFNDSFSLPVNRFSFGTQVVASGSKPTLEVLIVEKIDSTKEISMSELMNMNNQL